MDDEKDTQIPHSPSHDENWNNNTVSEQCRMSQPATRDRTLVIASPRTEDLALISEWDRLFDTDGQFICTPETKQGSDQESELEESDPPLEVIEQPQAEISLQRLMHLNIESISSTMFIFAFILAFFDLCKFLAIHL